MRQNSSSYVPLHIFSFKSQLCIFNKNSLYFKTHTTCILIDDDCFLGAKQSLLNKNSRDPSRKVLPIVTFVNSIIKPCLNYDLWTVVLNTVLLLRKFYFLYTCIPYSEILTKKSYLKIFLFLTYSLRKPRRYTHILNNNNAYNISNNIAIS